MKATTSFTLLAVISFVTWLTLVIGTGYVAIHFIIKFW